MNMRPNSFTQDEHTELSVRPLNPDDSVAYRRLRQQILALGDGCYFSDSYLREKQLSNEREWREWCTERRGHCIFGTFLGFRLVGVMMITRYSGFKDLEGDVTEWEATWLHPNYRNRGVARRSYLRVHQWTIAQGYHFAAVFIRADNLRSQEIRKRQGFNYVTTKRDEIWADGSVADVHTYILDLHQPVAQKFQIDRPAKAVSDTEQTSTRDRRQPIDLKKGSASPATQQHAFEMQR